MTRPDTFFLMNLSRSIAAITDDRLFVKNRGRVCGTHYQASSFDTRHLSASRLVTLFNNAALLSAPQDEVCI